MQARISKVKEIFLAAAEMEAPERVAFLDQACTGDSELRAQVERLLAAHIAETHSLLLDAPPAHMLSKDTLLAGRFRILRFLGRGGMGEVYEAADLELGGSVALKTLRPALLRDPEFLVRFRREVQLARKVTHPQICRVFDVGRHEDIAFLTMEFLDGRTLSSILRESGKIPETRVLHLARQLAEGLNALHEQGIVHRDFKPGNVMIVGGVTSGLERAVIVDFGLARAAAPLPDESGPTPPGIVHGTPDYMAPEQLMGQDVTPAADIFAFGLVLYEALTGLKPFAGAPRSRLTGEVVSPRVHVPELSLSSEAVILQCLSADPARRPPSALDIVEGWSKPAQLALPRRRRLVWAWLAAGAIFLAAFGGVTRLMWWKGNEAGGTASHVVVEPFKVLGGDDALRVFADGLMESITSRLSEFEGEKGQIVVAPASEVRLQNVTGSEDARKKLGADIAIEGSLQSQGDRVRLLLTVVDTRSHAQKETVQADDLRANALTLQDTAVERLTAALHVKPQTQHAADQRFLAPGAYDYYLQARGYLQRNDKESNIDSAIELLKRALDLDRSVPGGYSALGLAYWYKFNATRDPKWIEEARRNGEKALSLNPNSPDALITLGQIHAGTGHYEDAEREFAAAVAADSHNNQAWQGLAQAYESLNQFDRAEATYARAVALRPQDWNGYRQFGLFYFRRGDFDKAIQQYEKVIALTPDNAAGYVNLGAFQTRKGDTTAAEKSFQRALTLDPNRFSALTNLAKIYFDRAQYKDAIGLLERAVKVNPKSYQSWGNLGCAYRFSGAPGQSVVPLEKAIELAGSEVLVNPRKADLYAYLGYYHALLGRREVTVSNVERALALAPADRDVLVKCAEAEALLGNAGRAAELVRKALAAGYPLSTLRNSEPLRQVLAALKQGRTEQ